MLKHLPGSFLVLLLFPPLLITGGDNVHIRVNGLINQSIVLSLSEDPSRHVEQVIWNFKTSTVLSYTINRITFVEHPFKGRMEILDNGRALRIGRLRLEDSELYMGKIIFTNQTRDERIYNLTVYESVPFPCINIIEKKKNGDQCNVTLHCSVPTHTSSLSYTWKYRYEDSDYQLYNNHGDTIQISLQPESRDMEVMCIVQNPADQKNVSSLIIRQDYGINVRRPGDLTCWIKLYIYVPVLAILSLSLPLLCLWNRRKPAVSQSI